MVYAVVARVGLLLHLRRAFGLRGLVERGELVLRNDAAPSSTAAAPRFAFQAAPPPWESSTSLS